MNNRSHFTIFQSNKGFIFEQQIEWIKLLNVGFRDSTLAMVFKLINDRLFNNEIDKLAVIDKDHGTMIFLNID